MQPQFSAWLICCNGRATVAGVIEALIKQALMGGKSAWIQKIRFEIAQD